MPAKKTCFFIAPIGEEGSETRKRSDQVMRYIVDPPAKDLGYEVVRADKIEKPGIITSQAIQCVLDSALVVADLTGRNPNVFYELALRHAVRRPYIQLIELGEQIPFDLAGVRTISFNHRDLDSVEKCKADIRGHIEEMERAGGDVESPVSAAVSTQTLKRSEQPVDQLIASIREVLSQVAARTEETAAAVGELRMVLASQAYEISQGWLAHGTVLPAGPASVTPFLTAGPTFFSVPRSFRFRTTEPAGPTEETAGEPSAAAPPEAAEGDERADRG